MTLSFKAAVEKGDVKPFGLLTDVSAFGDRPFVFQGDDKAKERLGACKALQMQENWAKTQMEKNSDTNFVF